MSDEIVKVCVRHGPLTRAQVRVYKRNQKPGAGHLIQCTACKNSANKKYMQSLRAIPKEPRPPREPKKRWTTVYKEQYLMNSSTGYIKAADYATLMMLSGNSVM